MVSISGAVSLDLVVELCSNIVTVFQAATNVNSELKPLVSTVKNVSSGLQQIQKDNQITEEHQLNVIGS